MPAPQTLSECRLAIDDLDRAILTLAGRINAATYELLVLIREFDERAGWLKWGFYNCTQWLHWRCDLSLSAAREKLHDRDRQRRALVFPPPRRTRHSGVRLSSRRHG